MRVPFLDLKEQYSGIKSEIQTALQEVLDSTAFVLGPAVERFERAFAAYHGAKHCIAVSCGTSALHASLLAMGIGVGDEVIVPANSFFATAEAVSLCGARPIFADVCEDDYCIDPAQIAAVASRATKAVIPVHLYGQPARMDEILGVARDLHLQVLEDCAQAHGAEYRRGKVGTFGSAGAFSFYPGKNLGAYGEAGAVLTNDDEICRRIRAIREHGQGRKYHHDVVGHNYRMDGFQGAVLNVKLQYLDSWTEKRRRVANRYRSGLEGWPGKLPSERQDARHVYHLFVVRVKNRDTVRAALEGCGVATGIHYPVPLHLTGAYSGLGHVTGDFPVAEGLAADLVSLPIYPELGDMMIDHVVDSLRSCTAACPVEGNEHSV